MDGGCFSCQPLKQRLKAERLDVAPHRCLYLVLRHSRFVMTAIHEPCCTTKRGILCQCGRLPPKKFLIGQGRRPHRPSGVHTEEADDHGVGVVLQDGCDTIALAGRLADLSH